MMGLFINRVAFTIMMTGDKDTVRFINIDGDLNTANNFIDVILRGHDSIYTR